MLCGAERVVDVRHERPPHEVDHGEPAEPLDAAPRYPRRIVHGSQQGSIALEIRDDLGLVPNVVAGRDDVDTAVENLLRGLDGDASSRGGVLAIRDDDVEPQFVSQSGYQRFDRMPARLPHDVADKQHTHYRASPLRPSRTLVRIIGAA